MNKTEYTQELKRHLKDIERLLYEIETRHERLVNTQVQKTNLIMEGFDE